MEYPRSRKEKKRTREKEREEQPVEAVGRHRNKGEEKAGLLIKYPLTYFENQRPNFTHHRVAQYLLERGIESHSQSQVQSREKKTKNISVSGQVAGASDKKLSEVSSSYPTNQLTLSNPSFQHLINLPQTLGNILIPNYPDDPRIYLFPTNRLSYSQRQQRYGECSQAQRGFLQLDMYLFFVGDNSDGYTKIKNALSYI